MSDSKALGDADVINQEARKRWEANAEWWDDHFGEGNQFQNLLIGPATERLLDLKPGEAVLDVACGNGAFSRRMAQLGASVVAFDFSQRFLARAKARTTENADRIQYLHIDATDKAALLTLGKGRFDAAVCSMAFMDMSTIQPLLSALTELLRPSGRLVFSVLHPCFNSVDGIRQGMEEEIKNGEPVVTRFIKISGYIQPETFQGIGIVGQPSTHIYFHRPISTLYNACFKAGFAMDGIEEPVFDESAHGRGPLSWPDFKEIPPVLVTRMRLLRNGWL